MKLKAESTHKLGLVQAELGSQGMPSTDIFFEKLGQRTYATLSVFLPSEPQQLSALHSIVRTHQLSVQYESPEEAEAWAESQPNNLVMPFPPTPAPSGQIKQIFYISNPTCKACPELLKKTLQKVFCKRRSPVFGAELGAYVGGAFAL